MLGRVYVAGQHTSWVVVLDDTNSRIPVQIRPGNLQAILAGNNASEPTLEALPARAQLRNDAEVVTSGDGGLLPAGLPVGIVVINGREAKVALYADPGSAEDVRILNFSAPVEPMPKPSDQDLPAPAKLEPPATASVAEEMVSKRTPAQETKPAVHITAAPHASPAAVNKIPGDAAQPRDGTSVEGTGRDKGRQSPPNTTTDDQTNQ
jgi:rod shape-determining protein MreC